MYNELCHVVVNPAAGGGRTGRLFANLKPALHTNFGNEASIYITKMPGDARGDAREAVREGARLIVIIGGDGTIHESINGIFALPPSRRQNVTIAIISTGTGCGLARSLGIASTFREQIAVASGCSTGTIDLGKLHLTRTNEVIYFVNECQIGIGAEVVHRTRKGRKAFGGPLAYAMATVPLLFLYPNPVLDLSFDNSAAVSIPVTGLTIGNGAITGGGMHLTPRAVLDDGLIDVLVMKGQTPFQRAAGFARVRSGNHIRSPHFDYLQVRRVAVSAKSKLGVAADGEMAGSLPATFDVLPQVLQVHCPTRERMEIFHEHTGNAA